MDLNFGIDDLPCGALFTAPNRTMICANKYFSDELGWSLSELIGQRLEVLLTRGSHIFCDSYIFPMLLQEEECREAQLSCLTPSGVPVPVIVNAKNLANGQVAWSFSSAENRNNLLDELSTARKTAEEMVVKAEAANVAKTLFLTTMSHELRTPLNGVIGMTSALEQTPLSDAQQEMLATISSAGAHQLRLIEDLLDIAKIESGNVEIDPSPFNSQEVIKEICAMNLPGIEAKELRLLTDFSTSMDAIILADPKRVRQVVTNLISNAVKFTDQGSVTVRADLEQGGNDGSLCMRVSVADTGPGVPDDQKQHIFGEFSQGSHTEGFKGGGLGLGLAISKKICVLHGGDLAVTDSPGGGAMFTATFMVRQAPASAETRDQASEVALSTQPLKLLFAEDNSINQMVAKALFGSFSMTTVFVDNGRDAIELLELETFDAALIDIRMPDMTGVECARAIRSAEASTGRDRLPLIACTANVMADQVAEYLDNGFDRHFAKPFDLKAVSECIQWIAGQVACNSDVARRKATF